MANDPLNMHDVETAAAEAQAALWWGVYCDAMGNKLTTVGSWLGWAGEQAGGLLGLLYWLVICK